MNFEMMQLKNEQRAGQLAQQLEAQFVLAKHPHQMAYNHQ